MDNLSKLKRPQLLARARALSIKVALLRHEIFQGSDSTEVNDTFTITAEGVDSLLSHLEAMVESLVDHLNSPN